MLLAAEELLAAPREEGLEVPWRRPIEHIERVVCLVRAQRGVHFHRRVGGEDVFDEVGVNSGLLGLGVNSRGAEERVSRAVGAAGGGEVPRGGVGVAFAVERLGDLQPLAGKALARGGAGADGKVRAAGRGDGGLIGHQRRVLYRRLVGAALVPKQQRTLKGAGAHQQLRDAAHVTSVAKVVQTTKAAGAPSDGLDEALAVRTDFANSPKVSGNGHVVHHFPKALARLDGRGHVDAEVG